MKMSEVERLQQYHDFSQDTLETVAEVADRHRAFDSWVDEYNEFTDGPQRQVVTRTYLGEGSHLEVEVVDIRPSEEKDTLFYHLPMGNSLDPNMLVRLHVLADVLPNTRILASSNPGGIGVRSGSLSYIERLKVARGDFLPTVEPLLRYAAWEKIESAKQVGFSYGADKALAGAHHSSSYDIEATDLVAMEPASIARRGLMDLGLAFGWSSRQLKRYIEAAKYPAYEDARKHALKATHGMANYLGGVIFRPTNNAISRGIGQGTLEARLDRLMDFRPETRVTLVWGSESELASDGLMLAMQARHEEEGRQKVDYMRIAGGHHAMGDDVFLHAALIHDAINAPQ